MLPITDTLKQAIELPQVSPAMALEIDGYDIVFANVRIEKYIRIGDPDLYIGDDWVIGGYSLLDNVSDYISFNTGTTTKISQKLDVYKAQGSSVSGMVVSLIDKSETVTELVSPGFQVEDLLGREVVVKQGVKGTAYPEDYVPIFRGLVQGIDSGAGYINLILSNTEEKKRAGILTRTTAELANSIDNVQTTVDLVDASEFITPADTLSTYLKVNDEFMEYTGKATNTLTGVTRGLEGSTAAAANAGQDAELWCKVTGNGLDIALKLMLSQGEEWYAENLPVLGFQTFNILYSINNAVFFDKINLEEEYGVAVGDTIEVMGSGFNDQVTTIAEIGMIDDSTYIVVDGTIVAENPTTATARLKSKWNVLPIGLGMKPKEVDIKQHLYVRDTFLPVFDLEIYFKEAENTKEFIEQLVYLPMACFSVPRKARSSVIMHIAPLPVNDIKTLDITTVKNAKDLKIQRSTSENFFNEITFSLDYNPAVEKFKKTLTYESLTSKARISTLGIRGLAIDAVGLKTSNDGATRSRQSAARFLRRYQYGAEFIKGVDVHFKTGFAIEIGDVVVVDFDSLQLSNFDKGVRGGGFKLMEVLNWTRDTKSGEIKLDIVNTTYGVDDRYGVISPSSIVTNGSTTTKLRIKKSYTTKDFQRESTKWTNYVGQEVIVHSEDWSTVYTTTIKGFDNQDPQGMLVDALPTAPSAGWIIQCPNYPNTTDEKDLAFWKLRHAFFSPQVAVTATVIGAEQTKFTVSPSDVGRFFVGSQVRVHNYDYTNDAPEAKVIGIVGNDVEIDTATGFTVDSTHVVDLIGFPDKQGAYRVI